MQGNPPLNPGIKKVYIQTVVGNTTLIPSWEGNKKRWVASIEYPVFGFRRAPVFDYRICYSHIKSFIGGETKDNAKHWTLTLRDKVCC